ncbi:MoaD/ThiS family protein [Robiginitomaculum antarcticum]|uniref:MoaD/ThiS family protein n=1 Tax=Robiginitomaculum antarcticum TaxID=437507 RepID=UPI000526A29D
MQNIQVEFFGRISDRMGSKRFCDLDSAGMTVGQLRARLANDYEYDELLKPSIRPVINDVMVPEDTVISSQDRVAFFSPLSGG